jgi:hypothetical protein
MSYKWLLVIACCVLVPMSVRSQAVAQPAAAPADYRIPEMINGMSGNLSRIANSVDKLSGNWKTFFDSFSTNQGLRLNERQRKLLLAFEILNRSEQRLVTLQKMRLELTEKLSSFRLQLARIDDDLLPESLDRFVSTRGSLNAEQLRDIRRQALTRERNEINNIAIQTQRELDVAETEIRETQRLISGLRERLFTQIQAELIDL